MSGVIVKAKFSYNYSHCFIMFR